MLAAGSRGWLTRRFISHDEGSPRLAHTAVGGARFDSGVGHAGMTDQQSTSDGDQFDDRDAAVAAALEMDIDGANADLDALLARLSDRNVDPVVATLLETLFHERERLTERVDGSGVFFTKDDLTTALTAELGKKPHRQTVKRVWTKLQELGGADVRVKTRQVGRTQSKIEILAMEKETAEGLLEKRYLELDLLDGDAAATGGVTPVVTGTDGATV